MSRFEPTVRDAYAIYHEIAPATDLGREPPTASSAWGLILGGILLALGAVGHLVIKAGREKPPEEPEFTYQDQVAGLERVR